jgi:hypothetical protein
MDLRRDGDSMVLLTLEAKALAPPGVKGKNALSTESRRLVWNQVIWPLILDLKRPYFTIEEYHAKRDQVCDVYKIPHGRLSGGFNSVVTKGLLKREKGIYSLQFRLVPYMRRRNPLEYGSAVKECYSKQ